MSGREKVLIVTTSIGSKSVFRRFLKEYSRVDPTGYDAKLLIIGDKKTPDLDFERMPEHEAFVGKGFGFEYLDWKSQEPIMSSAPHMEDLIPWNRTTRRNIGYLIGYLQKYDAIITVDDDNYPVGRDFLKSHLANLACRGPLEVFEPQGKGVQWHNPCSFMENHIIPRGFPIEYRYSKPKTVKKTRANHGGVVVSAGFWLGDPDIDALTRVEGNPKNTTVKNIRLKRNFCLSGRVMAPFNSQNTAIRTDAIPALFLSAKIGRYDDIWAGYMLKALLYVTEELVMYGRPFVTQERNNHDLLNDLQLEMYGMRNTIPFTTELLNAANEIKTEGKKGSYLELTKELCTRLANESKVFGFYHQDMLRWTDLLENLRK